MPDVPKAETRTYWIFQYDLSLDCLVLRKITYPVDRGIPVGPEIFDSEKAAQQYIKKLHNHK